MSFSESARQLVSVRCISEESRSGYKLFLNSAMIYSGEHVTVGPGNKANNILSVTQTIAHRQSMN